MDPIGFLLLGPSATMLLMALHYGGNEFPWASARVICLLCGAIGSFGLLIWVEHCQGNDGILPLRMIRKRVVWCSCLVMASAVATTFCATYFLPVYFQAVVGASPIMSGIYMLPTVIAQLISASVVGVVGKRFFCLSYSDLG